jgi:hypothetical protein
MKLIVDEAQEMPPAVLADRDRIVRHGHGPQRSIQTGVGPVEVRTCAGP